MGINSITPRQNPVFATTPANTSRKPTPAIWGDCPWEDLNDPRSQLDGITFFDDFLVVPNAVLASAAVVPGWGQYTLWQGSSTTTNIVDAQIDGGGITISPDGNNESVSFNSQVGGFRLNTSVGKFWFECRIKTSSIAVTTSNFFVGLATGPTATVIGSATVPLADGVLDATNMNAFGFLKGEGATTDNGSVDFVYQANGVTKVVVAAAAAQLVADTFVKLGFICDPVAKKITAYVNGIPNATTKTITTSAGTDYPGDVAMSPMMAVNNGATVSTTTIDWWRFAQVIL